MTTRMFCLAVFVALVPAAGFAADEAPVPPPPPAAAALPTVPAPDVAPQPPPVPVLILEAAKAPQAPVAVAEAKWDVGAGLIGASSGIREVVLAPGAVGTSLVGFSSLGSAAPLGVSLQVERRVGESLWLELGLEVAGGTDFASHPKPAPEKITSPTVPILLEETDRDLAVGLSAGVRHVYNPGAAIEVSTFADLTLGYGYRSVETLSGIPQTDGTGKVTGTNDVAVLADATEIGAGLSVGVALEKKLLPGLAVRATAEVLDVSWRWGWSQKDNEEPSYHNGLAGGLTFRPGLSLRLAF